MLSIMLHFFKYVGLGTGLVARRTTGDPLDDHVAAEFAGQHHKRSIEHTTGLEV